MSTYPCGYSSEIIECSVEIPKFDNSVIEIYEELGKGSFGKIYKVNFNGESAIMKISREDSGGKISASREICNQNIASVYDISPKILDYWFCSEKKNNFSFVMEKAGDMTLEKFFGGVMYIDAYKNENTFRRSIQVVNAIMMLYYKILVLNYVCHIIHLDLHDQNIMVTVGDEYSITDLKFIDFGKSERNDEESETIVELEDEIIDNIDIDNRRLFHDQIIFFLQYRDSYAHEEYKNPFFMIVYNTFVKEYIFDSFENNVLDLGFEDNDEEVLFKKIKSRMRHFISEIKKTIILEFGDEYIELVNKYIINL